MKLPKLFSPSLRLRLFFLRVLEKAVGEAYTGPTPPRRLAERVRLFALFHPQATSKEWIAFADTFAANVYREGFVRGYEWMERGWTGPAMDPDQLAEFQAHDWSLAEHHPAWHQMLSVGYDPRSPLAGMSSSQRQALSQLFNTNPNITIDLSAYDQAPPPGHGIPGFHEDPTQEPPHGSDPG